ncbi:GntR family transcriptional regulator [Jatrophihabitans fulvus]
MGIGVLDGVGSLQEQVRRSIVQDITQGRLAPGAQLPTERQYADDLGVSLITVRTALAALVQAGYIQRASGRGTFVSQRPLPYAIRMMAGATSSLRDAGVAFDVTVLQAAWDAPLPEPRGALGLRSRVRAFHLRRSITIGPAPAILLESWLLRPAGELVERRLDDLAAGASLYRLLADADVHLSHAEARVDLVRADDDHATQLRLPFGAPLLAYTSTAVDTAGTAVEHARALYDAARFSLTIDPGVAAR